MEHQTRSTAYVPGALAGIHTILQAPNVDAPYPVDPGCSHPSPMNHPHIAHPVDVTNIPIMTQPLADTDTSDNMDPGGDASHGLHP